MSYQMLMPLLDPSESYVNGFEAGMLWKIMESGQPVKQYLVHTVNVNYPPTQSDGMSGFPAPIL